MKISHISLLTLGLAFTACHNSDIDFPDFEYQTISFAKQSPIRTVTLGDDGDYNTDLDNRHIIEIKAVLGGVNENRGTHSADFIVDNSLVDRITFADGRPVKAMPSNYYTLSGDQMVITKGNVIGGVQVQLTDAFFADPEAVGVNYVIPIVLTNSTDSILQGKPKDGIANPDRLNKDDWSVLPKDYTLYAVKFKNPYEGVWLSRGVDNIDNNGETKTDTRMPELWEKATLRYLTSRSLTRSAYTFSYTVPVTGADGKSSEKNISCELLLDIDANGNCTVSTETPGCTASGSGKWTYKGEPKAWGDKDRDLLKLSYTFSIDYVVNEATGQHATYKLTSEESLVMRDRQNKLEEFSYIMK